MEHISIDADPDAAKRRAVKVLREGGVMLFPTDTIYGLGGDALRSGMAARIRKAKGRVRTKHFPWLVSSFKMAKRHGFFPWRARRLAKKTWPGATTLVVRSATGEGTVGLRVPDHPWLREVIRDFGRPVIGTSANQSGKNAATTAEAAEAAIPRADIVFDGGTCAEASSEIIDCIQNPPKVLRSRGGESK